MDRDREKYYDSEPQEESQTESPAAEQPREEEIDDRRFFFETLSHLRSALQAGRPIPLSNKRLVDVDMCLMMVSDLERNLPDAIQMSMQIISEQERIREESESAAMNRVSKAEMRANAALEKAKTSAEQIMGNAENEARMILQDAEDRANHMVQESEIVRRAREEARNITNEARVNAQELRLKAAHDAEMLMADAEARLTDALKTVRRSRAEYADEGN